jgi:hypothetical protein
MCEVKLLGGLRRAEVVEALLGVWADVLSEHSAF